MKYLVVTPSFYKQLKELGYDMKYYVKEKPVKLSAEVLRKYTTGRANTEPLRKLATPKSKRLRTSK